jgi:peptide/nickel transport system substrate-binding protein
MKSSKLLVIFLLSFFCVACLRLPDQHLERHSGGSLRLLHKGQDPKTFNPWIASDSTSSSFAGILYEGLITFDPDTDEPLPHLAEKFLIQEGGKKITIKLRDDILWSDGKPISADDVLFTWQTLIREGVATSSLKDILEIDGKFPELKKIDDKTVEFRTIKVFAPFLRTLAIEIAPKHDIEKYFLDHGAKSFQEKQNLFNNYLNVHTEPSLIVSSGAFKLKSIRHGERIIFQKNPLYFKTDKSGRKLPYLDQLIYSYVQDPSAEIFRFFAGDALTMGVTPSNAALVKSLESKYSYKLYDLGPSGGTNFVWFNMSKNVPEPKYSWFNNKYFRRAISYALDRESIVNNVFQGMGTPLFTAESLRSPYLHPTLKSGYKQDLKRARELLRASGFSYKKINGEDVLFDQKGNRVEFDLFTNAGNTERELIGVIVVSNLKALGIKANFKLLEFNNFVGRLMQGKDYDAGIMGLTGDNEPNNGANVWKSNGRLHLFDIKSSQDQPLVRDWEKEIDEIFSEGVQHMDFQSRKKYYDRFQEIIAEENPLIYLASPNSLSAISYKIIDVKPTKYGGLIPYLSEVKLEGLDFGAKLVR